jgi:hypothetical protein
MNNFSVFAVPGPDGRTPRFVAMQGGVAMSRNGFTAEFDTRQEAEAFVANAEARA